MNRECIRIYSRKTLLGAFVDPSMAAPPARARADYDYLIKLLLIGDSGQYFNTFFIYNPF